MKILFIQLPLLDHSYSYINGNINYAPATISAFIGKNFTEVECEYLPFIISNFCSDEIIVNYILKVNPDIINFTAYLWNVERSLRIAKLVRAKNEHAKIIFGGSEINEGSIVFNSVNNFVDYFVKGEGEWFYSKLLLKEEFSGTFINENYLISQSASDLIAPETIVEPLANNYLDIMIDGSTFLELVRGCPYRCSYCLYSNTANKVRELNPDLLFEIIKSKRSLEEIYILAPTFDKFHNFREILTELSDLDHGISLHTEVRAEIFDDELAELMYSAGFRSLEVGLQTMNPRALKMINRHSNVEKELLGITALQKAGIDLKIGVIPGLPDDDPDNFYKTIDILIEQGLSDGIEIYPLMILPGSQIREKAIVDKINFQEKPPYFYHEGWNFTADDIKSINMYFESVTGFTQSVYSLPDFIQYEDFLYIKSIFINSDNLREKGALSICSSVDTSVIDLHIEINNIDDFYDFMKELVSINLNGRMFNVILEYNAIIDENLLIHMIDTVDSDCFHERLNFYNPLKDRLLYRFYQVFTDFDYCNEASDSYNLISTIFKPHANDLSLIENLSYNANLLIEDSVYETFQSFLIDLDDIERIAFCSEKSMKNFYDATNNEILSIPINFGAVHIS